MTEEILVDEKVKCPKCLGSGRMSTGWTCDLCHGRKKVSLKKDEEWREMVVKKWMRERRA